MHWARDCLHNEENNSHPEEEGDHYPTLYTSEVFDEVSRSDGPSENISTESIVLHNDDSEHTSY